MSRKSMAYLIAVFILQVLIVATAANATPIYSNLMETSKTDTSIMLTGIAMDTDSLSEMVFYKDDEVFINHDCRNRPSCTFVIADIEYNTTSHTYKMVAVSNDITSVPMESNEIVASFTGYTPELPSWSNAVSTPGSPDVYNETQEYNFSVDWQISGPDEVLFESDFTGAMVNETASRQYDTYFYTVTGLDAGSYSWQMHASDTNNHSNSTDVFTYVVEKADPVLELTLEGNASDITVERGSNVNAVTEIVYGEAAATALYLEDVELVKTSMGDYWMTFNESGSFELRLEYAGTSNFNADNLSRTVTVADTTAVGPITNPVFVGATDSTLAWNWTVPSDGDFNHTVVTLYLDSDNSIVDSQVVGAPSNGTESSVNFTGLNYNTSYLAGFATYDTTGNSDPANDVNVSAETTLMDADAPVWSNPVPANDTTVVYDPSALLQFNVTWDEPHMDTVEVAHNFTGAPLTEAVTGNDNNIYYFNYTPLAVGSYEWSMIANDTANNLNTTDIFVYNVVQADPVLNFTLNGNESDIMTERLVNVAVEASIVSGETAVLNLYVNSSLNISDMNQSTVYNLSFDNTGIYPITLEYVGTQNYSAQNITRNVSVYDSMATSPITNLTLGTVTGTSIDWSWDIPLDDDYNHTVATLYLASDNSTVDSQVAVSSVSFTNLSIAEEYWASFQTYDVYGNTDPANIENSSNVTTLDTLGAQFSGYSNFTADYEAGANHTINVTVTDNVGVDTVIFELNGTNMTNVSQNGSDYSIELSDLAAGVYPSVWHANDTAGNWSSSDIFNVTINRIPSSVNLSLNGAEQNVTVLEGEDVNISAERLVGEGNLEVTNDASVLYNDTNPSWDQLVNFPIPGVYNITARHAQSQNYTESLESLYVTVDAIVQNVSITSDSAWKGTSNVSNANFTITVQNTGNVPDNYTVSFVNTDGAATALLNGSTGTYAITGLAPSASENITLEVGDSIVADYNVTVTVDSDTNASVTDSVVTTTTVADTSEVINSTINSTYYAAGNYTIVEIPQLLGASVMDSIIDALSFIEISSILGSSVDTSNVTNVTMDSSSVSGSDVDDSDVDGSSVDTSSVASSTVNSSSVSGSGIVDSDVDVSSVLVNSTVNLSQIMDSSVGLSNVSNSTVNNSRDVMSSQITDSSLDTNNDIVSSVISASTVSSQGDLTGSNVDNSTISNSGFSQNIADSNVTDSALTNVTMDSSEVILSTVSESSLVNETLVQNSTVDSSSADYSSVYDSTVDASNLDSDALVDASSVSGSNVSDSAVHTGSVVVNSGLYQNSDIDASNVTDSQLTNCTVILSDVNGITASDCYIDPSNVTNSTISGNANITDSNVSDSNMIGGNLTISNVDNSDLVYSVVDASTITDSVVRNTTVDSSTVESNSYLEDSSVTASSTVTNSNVTDSTVDASTVTNSVLVNWAVVETGSTVTDSTLDNMTVTNSDVVNTDIENGVVNNANITDGTIYTGTITQNGQTYDADASGPGNLSDVINYAPVAGISPSATTITAGGSVTFISTSTDPNPSDNLTYDWDFGDGSNHTNASVETHAYGSAGAYMVVLTVTDDDNASDSENVTITVNAPNTGGSSGGSSGGRSSSYYYQGTTYDVGIPMGGATSMELKEKDIFLFKYGGENHSITILDINTIKNEVRVRVNSEPIEIIVMDGAQGGVNLDAELRHDVLIKVDSITSSNSALFTLSLPLQDAGVPSLPLVVPQEPEPEPQPEPEPEPEPEEEEEEEGTGLFSSIGGGISGAFSKVFGGIAGVWNKFASWLTSSGIYWKIAAVVLVVAGFASAVYVLVRRAQLEMEIRDYY